MTVFQAGLCSEWLHTHGISTKSVTCSSHTGMCPCRVISVACLKSFSQACNLQSYWLVVFRCQFLHRTAGDTERRYHLRYYKTSVCVHETDSRGHCVKNGPHCAFAHGAMDMRPPAYDIRELQAADGSGKDLPETPLGSSLEKDRIINDDPRWNGKIRH